MEKREVEFRGGLIMAYIPMAIFLFFCILYFMVFKVFEMHALAMGAFVGLLVGAPFAKNYRSFWVSALKGIGDHVSVEIILILFVVGLFAALIKACNVTKGFVWLADTLGIYGSLFTTFTFLAACIISTATGTSIGTMFTAFPIFYPAGVLLGSSPAMLAGAIVSGAIFGDNLAPISDSTIISVNTQNYATKFGTADIGGAVATRLKYALVAAALSCALFMLTGGGIKGSGAMQILEANKQPKALIMLIPVLLMLIYAVKSRDIYKATSVGIVLGIITGLLAGLLKPSDILNVTNGTTGGFFVTGIGNMMGVVTLVISVFAIMGVLRAAGAIEVIVRAILRSKLGRTAISIFNLLYSGVTSATMITFGPVMDEIGKRQKLHPYRRANLLDGLANSITVCVPFLAAFVFIGTILTKGYDFVKPLTPVQVASGMFHPMMLFVVFMFAIITGWGRTYEGPNGEQVKRIEDAFKDKDIYAK
jgi:Na+/H+ antiporter NhaC